MVTKPIDGANVVKKLAEQRPEKWMQCAESDCDGGCIYARKLHENGKRVCMRSAAREVTVVTYIKNEPRREPPVKVAPLPITPPADRPRARGRSHE